MKLRINGEEQVVPDAITVGKLLEHLGITPARVAVEVNFDVVKRAERDRHLLADGDKVEIVSFVGGG
jgi:sulfur carrier protein